MKVLLIVCLVLSFSHAGAQNHDAQNDITDALSELSLLRQANPRSIPLIRIENYLQSALMHLSRSSSQIIEELIVSPVAAINCRDARSEPNNPLLKDTLQAQRNIEKTILSRCFSTGAHFCNSRNIFFSFSPLSTNCTIRGVLNI